jgi:hypothetical protein
MLIKEFLPNPVGKDQDGEYIALLNNGKSSVDVGGWKLKDASGKTSTLTPYVLPPAATLRLPYRTTKLSLGNTGETIFLYDPAGTLVDQLSYSGTAVEGRVITRVSELTPELRSKSFTSLAESYPGVRFGASPADTLTYLQKSPIVFMVLVGIILAAIAVWVMRQLTILT